MAGLFDLHLLQGIQAGTKEYLDSSTHFKELFKGVGDGLLTTWFNELQTPRPVIKASFTPGKDNFPVIAIQLEEESTDTQSYALGRYSHTLADNREVEKILLSQQVSVTILSKHPEITRCLHVVCRAAATRLNKKFLEFYDDVKYQDAADLSPDTNLLAEELGIYVRRQRYMALSYVDVPVLGTPESKQWQVGITDAVTRVGIQAQAGSAAPGKVGLVD